MENSTATAADGTVQKVGGSRKNGINAEWRVDGEVCELERERGRGIRKTEVKPKDIVKVRGRYVRDGAVHIEMDSLGEKDMGIGETERRSIRNVYRSKSSAARRRTNTFNSLQKEEFNEAYMKTVEKTPTKRNQNRLTD